MRSATDAHHRECDTGEHAPTARQQRLTRLGGEVSPDVTLRKVPDRERTALVMM